MSDPQSQNDDEFAPADEQIEPTDEELSGGTEDASEEPAQNDDESASQSSHWSSLIEEIGVDVKPDAASRSQPQRVEVEFAARPAKQEKPQPRASDPAPGRKHWAGLAGELGIDFPELPPEPEGEPVAEEPSEAAEPVDESPPREPIAKENHDRTHGTVVPIAPESLVEDTPAAVSEMLDEVEEPELFGDSEIDEEILDDPEAIEARGSAGDDEIVDADLVEEIDDETSEDSGEQAADEEESDRPRRRRGRRRGGRRRRRSERSDSDASDDDANDDVRDEEEEEEISAEREPTDDGARDDDREDEEERRPRRRSRSRGRGERRSRSEGSSEGAQKEYKFPMWSEAIDLLVSKNMESRKSGSGREGRSSRGGRGRGRRR